MKIRALMCAALSFSLLCTGSLAWAGQDETEAAAEEHVIHSLVPQSVIDLIGGKTFQARLSGYGWGDSPETLKFDFTVREPMLFSADAIESLKPGDSIDAGMDVYTVKTVDSSEDSTKIIPEEVWLTPVVFTMNEEGTYTAEDGNGPLTVDSFSFSCRIKPDLVFVDAQGDTLTAQDLMDALSEDTVDTDTTTPQVTFDEEGDLTTIDFS
ncbi:MAG TPA: hypothetical protein DHV42_08520 [Lachnospiraceae bacterium]|nr:hypothetical protein [Lachnospiraceae bacterium]